MGLLQDIFALLVTFALAGALLGLAIFPERLPGGERTLLAIALAAPATILAAAPGLVLRNFGAASFLIALAALAAIAVWRVPDARDRADEAIAAVRRHIGGREPLTAIAIVAAIAIAWFGVLGPLIDRLGPLPQQNIVYYHWGVVQKVLAAGHIPATSPEWGEARPFPVEYLFSAIHGAATGALGGGAGYLLLERYQVAMIAFVLLAAFGLGRRWLPTWWAWVGAVLMLSTNQLQERLLNYKPEMLSAGLALWSAWLLDEALERRSLRWGACAGGLVATAYLAHPVGAILSGPLWLGILAGRGVGALVRRRRERRAAEPGSRPSTLRGALPALRVLVVGGALFLAIFAVTKLAAGSTSQNLLQNPKNGVDLTRVLYREAYLGAAGRVGSSAKRIGATMPECSDLFARPPAHEPFPRMDISALWARGLLALAVLGFLILSLTRLPEAVGRATVTWLVFGGALYGVARLICFVYHTWAPERVAPLRVIPYWGLTLPVIFAAAGWMLAVAISRTERWRRISAQRGRVFGALPVIAVTVPLLLALTPIGGARLPIRPERSVTPAMRDAYAWFKKKTLPSAVVLVDGYTEGVLNALADRTGELDGRTPYLQPDPWRSDAIRLLKDMRAFFKHPVKDWHLVPHRVRYIVITRQSENTGGSRFPVAAGEFRSLQFGKNAKIRYATQFDAPPVEGLPNPPGAEVVIWRVLLPNDEGPVIYRNRKVTG